MISRQQSLSFLLLLFLSSIHAIILDAVPSPCTSACRPVASSLENCQFLTCICDAQHGRDFQSCLTCLYRLVPNNETYAAAQGILQNFQTTCRDRLSVALNVTISPSGTTSSTPIPSSSRSSNSTSIGTSSTSRAPGSNSTTSRLSQTPTPTSTVSSNSTTVVLPSSSSTNATISSSSTKSSSVVTPSGPPIKLGNQEEEQICRLRSDYPSRRVERLSYAPTAEEKKKPLANTRAVLAFLAVLVFIPIGVLLVRK